MHNKRVMVVGGTGLFGQPVVQAFQRKGFEPVILSHDEKKAQKRFSGSCNIRYADVTNPGSLKGIFDDISSLHINLNTLIEEDIYKVVADGVQNLIGEAKDQHLKLITYTSQATVSETHRWFPLINARLDAEKHIIHSGIPYLIIRPTHFMEAMMFFIRGNQLTPVKDFDIPIQWISGEEFGDFVADFHVSGKEVNNIIYLKGPETYTLQQALEIYKQHSEKNIRMNVLNMNMLRSIAQFSNNLEMQFVASYLEYLNSVREVAGYDENQHGFLTLSTSLEEWTRLQHEKKLFEWSSHETSNSPDVNKA